MTYHDHTEACLCGGELNELCCYFLRGDRLQNSERFVVTWKHTSHDDLSFTRNVFTDTADDARALVKTEYPGAHIVAVRFDPQPDPAA